MIAHSGRIGLETIPYRLLGILSRERRDPTPEGREYWSGLISYLCDQLDCDRITLNNAVLLLELDGLTRFELESQGCLVIEVLRPVMIGRTARTGD